MRKADSGNVLFLYLYHFMFGDRIGFISHESSLPRIRMGF